MPVALGVNGGVLGSNNLPTATTFRGVFTPNEVARAIALGFWPINKSQAVTGVAGSGALGTLTVGSNADPYFNLTTLLLSTTATNGAQNNIFQDSSTNNFTITRNGNTTQGTFSPFSQTGWGNYFDGTGDYLNGPNNAAFAFSGNFTIEAWVYVTSLAATRGIFDTRSSGNEATGVAVYIDTSGIVTLRNNAVIATSSSAIVLNSWNHVAVTRNSSSIKIWLNGDDVTSGTPTSSTNFTQQNSFVGSAYASGFDQMLGYISNLRIVNGTAVYTGNFTPPTAPLTAISGTSLLTCQSNRFIDNSTNNFTITRNGDTRVVAFSPFNPTSAWSASTVGGSGYFDGTGDYLSIAANAQFLPGANVDFSFEAWVYLTATPSASAAQIVGLGEYGLNADWTLTVNSSLQPTFYINKPFTVTSSKAIALNSWNHIQATRSGTATNNVKLFLNGEQVGQGTETGTLDYTGNNLTLGGDANGDESVLTGYISGVRLINGTGYTSVTVPTAPPTAITNTVLLLNFTNANIYDATAKNVLETVGNAQVSTTQSKWSPTSMYFDGTGDYLLIPDNPSQRIGTGNFTVECWVYRNASGTYGLIGKGTGTTGWLLSLNSSNQVVFTYGSSTITSTGTISATTWTHIAVVRSGTGANLTKIYIGGTNDGTGTVSTDFNQTNAMYVAADRTGGSNANAYVQDTRVTLYARYSANFTPPTAAFPVQ